MRPRNKRREASQKHRLLAWARAGHPLHQDDWYVRGPDGAGPIKALRSRISELEREDGYGFHHFRRVDGTVEYRLAHVPEPAPVEQLADHPRDELPPEPLFELAASPPAPTAPPLNAALTDFDREEAA
jgi:hypothetical protein